MTDPVREALAELVACRKDSTLSEIWSKRWLAAWAAARAALAQEPVARGVYLSPEVAKMADACPPVPASNAPADDLVRRLREDTAKWASGTLADRTVPDLEREAAAAIEALQAEVARLLAQDESVPREREYRREVSLRERLLALSSDWQAVRPSTAKEWGECIVTQAARLALEEAARECEQRWRDGYRGEVTVGFAHVIRALAQGLE